MKKLFFLIAAVSVITACNRKPEETGSVTEGKVELTPCIIHDVMLRDTTRVKTIYARTDSGTMSLWSYQENWDLENILSLLYYRINRHNEYLRDEAKRGRGREIGQLHC